MEKTSYKGVYKRGETYTYIIDITPDPVTGSRRQKSKGGFRTAREAARARTEALSKVYKGNFVEENRMTVAEYLRLYLKTHAKPNFKKTSYDTEKTVIESRIIPALGRILLQKLEPLTIREFYAELREMYSDEYVRNIHGILHRSLRQAFIMGLIPEDIMKKVRTPKVEKKEMEFWSFEEWTHFLNVAKGHVHYIVFSLAIRTGMRRGEVLGLRWSDIDFERKTIFVQQTLNWTRDGIIFQSPKTTDSIRTIEMDSFLIADLVERKKQVEENKKRFGKSYEDHDLVCCYEYGGPIKPKRITEGLDVLIKKAGLKKVRFHDLRHTHASWLLKLGINPKVAAERLGMSPQMFNERYAHLLPTMQREAVDRIEMEMQKAKKTVDI